MPRACELTGTSSQSGHNVSHSNRKTNRRFNANLQRVTLHSDALKREVPLRVTTRALRTVTKHGGLDSFLLKQRDEKLPPLARRLKHRVQKALSGGGKKKSA